MLATRSKGSNTATEGGKHDASGRITTRDFGIFLMPTRQSGNAGPVTNVHPSLFPRPGPAFCYIIGLTMLLLWVLA